MQASPTGCSKKVRWQLITHLWGFEKEVQEKVEGLRPGVLFYEFTPCATFHIPIDILHILPLAILHIRAPSKAWLNLLNERS
ncbi:MAG: hypothetical protein IM537_03285 [Pseudanabaena sp. M57BS1SP1A06MG]|nr:hypothetical protein [Pseudanabaena sp. M57BS1SP1A06MG]